MVFKSVSPLSINRLPSELLLLIFKFAFMLCCHGAGNNFCWLDQLRDTLWGWEHPYLTTWSKKEDLCSPTLFPYPYACVSRLWRALIATIPIFWTRVVALVDSRPTTISRVQKQLELSRDLPLDVTVLRSPGSYEEDDPEESSRTRALIDVLKPHFKRCRTIHFNVMSIASLPSIVLDFCGTVSQLVDLQLRCRVDLGRASYDDGITQRSGFPQPPDPQCEWSEFP